MNDSDVAVIGGGLAGVASAIQLARAGRSVILIEREKTAHHKVCGEFISFEAQHYLKKLGVNLLALGAVAINEIQISRRAKSVSAKLPFEALSLSRYCLDEMLLQQASQENVIIRRGVNAIKTVRENDVWNVALSDGTIIKSGNVVLATGKHDVRALPRAGGIHNDLIGFKIHFKCTMDTMENIVSIVLFNGGYAGIEPIEADKINLCLVVSKKRFAELGKSWDALLNELMHLPSLSFLANASPCMEKPLAIYGIPYGFVHQQKDEEGLYRVGDQMAVIPSFLGNGMSIALHTGFMAADAVKNNIDNNIYHAKVERELKTKVRMAGYLSQALVHPILQKAVFASCRLAPSLAHWTASRSRLDLDLKSN